MIRHPSRALLVLVLVGASALPVPAAAQALPSLSLIQVLYNSLKTAAKPDGDLKKEIDANDKALAEAIRSGRSAEARRLLAKGITLVSGRPWTDALDYAASIVLRTERQFVDPSRPFTLRVEQIYAPSLALQSSVRAHILLRQPGRPGAAGSTMAAGARLLGLGLAQGGPIEKDLGTFEGVSRDLRESPFIVDLDLAGVPDGRHLVEVELLDGMQAIAARALAIEVQKGLDRRLDALANGLGSLKSDLARALAADVLYPADYIRKVSRGQVEMGTFDVGAELAAAETALASLKAGKDPFAGRTGEVKRHYQFVDAGEIMPYRMYVPARYAGKEPLPLIVALHGLGGTEDSFFTAYGRQLPVLAEARGYLVVAPLGYRVDGGYGFAIGGSAADPAQKRRRDLSERDVLNVVDLVRRQYRVDEGRIYLLGHSMGAIGTWALGAKYPERWAALACFSGFGAAASVEKTKQIPQFVVHGDADTTVPVLGSRAMVAEMKRLGVEHQYIEVPGGTHMDVVEPNLRVALDFFDTHQRPK